MSTYSRPESASFADQNRLAELLAAAVPDCHPETVFVVPESWHRFTVIRDSVSRRVVAACALLPLGDGRAEIRGLVVDPEHRGYGLASIVVRAVLAWARKCDLEAVCVTRRPEFFRRFGFKATRPSWLHLRKRRKPGHESKLLHGPRYAMAFREAESR